MINRGKKHENSLYKNLAIWTIIVSFIIRIALALITKEGGDPAWHLNVARFIGENLKFPVFEFLGREAFSKPPLFHIIGGIFYNIFNIFNLGDMGIKLLSPLAGTGFLIFTYLIAKELTNERIAFLSTLFLSFLPLSMYLSVTGHIEMITAFFFIGTIYFMIKEKIYLSGIFLGLSLLGKEFSIMLVPIMAYYYFKKRKEKKEMPLKKFLIIMIIGALISAPFYIRNLIIFGNPIWPFLISAFPSKYIYPLGLKPELTPSMIYEQFGNPIQIIYLEFFGVPAGRIDNLLILNVQGFMLWIWFASTLVFLIPIFLAIKERKKIRNNNILISLILINLSLLIVTLAMNGATTPRYFIYSLPAIAILWALEMDMLIRKYGRVALIIMLVISSGFVLGEIVKAKVGADMWDAYKKDFKWIKENTSENALIMAGGQAMSYRLHREAIYIPDNQRMSPSYIPEWKDFDYIFINQQFKPDKRVILEEELVNKIKNSEDFEIVYENKDTGTEIYKKII